MKLHPIAFMFLAGVALAQGSTETAPLGRWVTESGNLEIDIAPCAEPPAGVLCGKVVRVLANRSMGAPGAEMKPADARPVLGMTLLTGIKPAGDGEYRATLYNRENAKHYSATLQPADPDQLLVRGYVFLTMFGKTQVWRRPSAEGAVAPSGSSPANAGTAGTAAAGTAAAGTATTTVAPATAASGVPR